MAASKVFSDAQIAEILELITNQTGHLQYIGARYVPIFGRKNETSIIWDNSKPYEPLTIVLYQGNSYTSRQYVPAGIDILNQDFWANTGNYNAQVEQYRQEVLKFDERITQNANEIDSLDGRMESAEDTLDDLGTAAKKNWTDKVEKDNSDLVTSEAVYNFSKGGGFFGKNGIFVCDSWGRTDAYGVTKPFFMVASEILGMNMIPVIQGSTGYIHGGSNNYLSRLQRWVAANQDKVNDIHYVFVEGSSNDARYDGISITQAVEEFEAYVLETFINAQLIIIPNIAPPNPWLKKFDTNDATNDWVRVTQSVVNESVSHTYKNRTTFLINSFNALFGYDNDTIMNTDQTHPKQIGHNILGKWLANALLYGIQVSNVDTAGKTFTGYGLASNGELTTDDITINISNKTAYINNGMLHYNATAKFTIDDNTNIRMVVIPDPITCAFTDNITQKVLTIAKELNKDTYYNVALSPLKDGANTNLSKPHAGIRLYTTVAGQLFPTGSHEITFDFNCPVGWSPNMTIG